MAVARFRAVLGSTWTTPTHYPTRLDTHGGARYRGKGRENNQYERNGCAIPIDPSNHRAFSKVDLMLRDSKALSWAMFSFSVGVLALVVWVLFISPTPAGQWRNQIVGNRIGELPVEDFSDRAVQLQHPSILYFFSRECRFCPPASERINAHVAAYGTGGLPVYAITNEWDFPEEEARKFAPGIQVIRLTRTVPHLTFLTEIPLLVRTDAAGAVQGAFVGVPKDSVLAQLRAPRRTGSARR
jgi:hypothetical protein